MSERLQDKDYLCPRCGDIWADISRTAYYINFRCACGHMMQRLNGPRVRGFIDRDAPHNQPYETKLTVMAVLEVLGAATSQTIAIKSGLSDTQVNSCLRRLQKAKGAHYIEPCGEVAKFPCGKARLYRLTDSGRWYLGEARRMGYIQGPAAAAAD